MDNSTLDKIPVLKNAFDQAFSRFVPPPLHGIHTFTTQISQGDADSSYFIRSHMALDGKTPSDMAGIKIEGNNKCKLPWTVKEVETAILAVKRLFENNKVGDLAKF